MKVDFFIVGAPKAGTSSIHSMLNEHPDVCMSAKKEPNYFSHNEVAELYSNANYQAGLMIFETEQKYHKQYQDISKICGEASVSYLIYPNVAERIQSYNPDAKIIICLRDPVDRAISHYRMDRRLGFTNKTLQQIVDKVDGSSIEHFQYIEGSVYTPQLERYLKFFDRKQLMIIDFKEMIENPKQYAHDIQNFLNVPILIDDFPHENTGFDTNNQMLSVLYRSRKIRELGKTIVPRKAINALKKISARGKQDIPDDLRARIYDCVKHDLSDLERILGRAFKHWRAY